jgi:hypothetical protein
VVTKPVFVAQLRANAVIRMSLCKHECIEVLCTYVVFGRWISPSSSDDMVGRDQHNPITPASPVMLAFRRRGIGAAYAHPLMATHSSQRSDGCHDDRFLEGGGCMPNNHNEVPHNTKNSWHTPKHTCTNARVHCGSNTIRCARKSIHTHHLVTFTDQSPLPKGSAFKSCSLQVVCTGPATCTAVIPTLPLFFVCFCVLHAAASIRGGTCAFSPAYLPGLLVQGNLASLQRRGKPGDHCTCDLCPTHPQKGNHTSK